MASAIGQQGSLISAQGASAGPLVDPTIEIMTLREEVQKKEESRGAPNLEKLLDPSVKIQSILKNGKRKEALIAKYRKELSDYCPSALRPEDDQIEAIIKLEEEFINLVAKYDRNCPSDYFTRILADAESHGGWAKVYLLSTYTRCFQFFYRDGSDYFEPQVSLGILLNEIKECLKDNPTKFDLQEIIDGWGMSIQHEIDYDDVEPLLLEVISLQLEYQALPGEVNEDIRVEVYEPEELPRSYKFFLKRCGVERSALRTRDQKEIDRFHSIFNRIDFMLVWEEKATSRSGVGILPPDLIQKIAKSLTWPQVRWELRDDEKAFDAEQNPIYKQALRERQIANDTAKRILGSVKRPSEARVEELDDEPQKKRARTAENP